MSLVMKCALFQIRKLRSVCSNAAFSCFKMYYINTNVSLISDKLLSKSEVCNVAVRNLKMTLNLFGSDTSCWKCNSKFTSFQIFCDKCNVIQKPDIHITYFGLLNLPTQFEINETELSKKFKDLQRTIHPDKFSLRPAEELHIAEEYSSLINKAYSVLRQPWSRGVYLLKTMGVDAEQETTVDDPEILLIVMERNEIVAAANDMSDLLSIDSENKTDMGKILKDLTRAFKAGELQSAKRLLFKLRYFTNIEDKINEKKLKFGVV